MKYVYVISGGAGESEPGTQFHDDLMCMSNVEERGGMCVLFTALAWPLLPVDKVKNREIFRIGKLETI